MLSSVKLIGLPLNSLVHEKSIYPRSMVNWKTTQTYYRAMLADSKFPPITVAKIQAKHVIVDGVHRFNALHLFFKKSGFPLDKEVEVELIECKNLTDAFIEAVRRNMIHGRQLSLYEKLEIYKKLKKTMKLANVAVLLNMETGYLEKLAKQRIIRVGPEDVTLKSTFAHLDKKKLIITKQEQTTITGESQIKLIEQLLAILKGGWIEVDNKNVAKKLRELKDWLDTMAI